MIEVSSVFPKEKSELYPLLMAQFEALMGDDTLVLSDLSNASALLNEALDTINWVGFYLMKEETLHLGPFQGKLACTKIPVGRGVCGTAAALKKTQLIKNVHEFPGHIACDGASNSEIVIPMFHQGKVIGVLDIDSPILERFDEADQAGLEAIVRVIEKKCDWEQFQI